MSKYIVGAIYKASKEHIENAGSNNVTFKADGKFKVSALSPNGGAWSHDASYSGDFHPELAGVGVYCADPDEVRGDELIASPDNGQEGETDE